MIKKISLGLLGLFILGLAYLLFWPVPIQPVAWDAPVDKGYVGDFAPNMKLAGLKTLAIGEHHGPEDVDGRIEDGDWIVYTSTQSGDIIRINTRHNKHSVFANTGGVALGLQFDAGGNLIVADAHKGLLSLDKNGKITVLTNRVDGTPIDYADEMDIGMDGKIYFSDASTKFSAKTVGNTLAASIMEFMEHGSTGRILVYDPADQSTKILIPNLSFPNGVAMCPKDECLLFNETGTYTVKKYWLKGPKTGETETIADNLPGFPDNLNRGLDGRYWLGLTSPRSAPLDKFASKPFMRKVIQRLPARFKPKATNYGVIIAIDVNGKTVAQYQDPSGAYPLTTGATELGDGWLYISSLAAKELGRKNLQYEKF